VSRRRVEDGQDARYASLLALIELAADAPAVPELLRRFATVLKPAVGFDDCVAVGLEPHDGPCPDSALACRAVRVDGSIVETISAAELDVHALGDLEVPVVLADLDLDGQFSALAALLRRRGNRSACVLPLRPRTTSILAVCLGSANPAAFVAADLGFLQRAASVFALAVEAHDKRQSSTLLRRIVETDRDRWRTLLEVNNALVGTLDIERLRVAIANAMPRIIACDFINLILFDEDGERIGLFSLDPDVPEEVSEAIASINVKDIPFADPKALRAPIVCEPHQLTFLPESIRQERHFRSMKHFCLLPLKTPHRTLGVMALSTRSEDTFAPNEIDHAAQAANQIAIAVENALAYQEIAALKDRLTQEKLYLEDEIRVWNEFEEIVGESAALKRVLTQAREVADTDTTVLLLGETGTGKELFARAIHNLSARRSRTLVAVNCAASPENLLESEWFGYEKGAFTGAQTRKTGRFELADKGTLFLDEIGDVPLHLQAKLLRVLEEHEIERLGATRPVRVDFRLIAATNSDLQSMVSDKTFRSDLFYRLNVFPIRIPPLRERPDDIPPLVACFTQRYAKRLRRPIDSVPRETMDALCRWPWPGNVRELQNVIERAVILSPGRTLQVPTAEFAAPALAAGTLESAEREHIMKALLDTNWVVGGPNGAAARLGLKRTTLISTMKRLGIERPSGV
jgi:formate hydrogenlyase transcriptional activator